MAQRRMFSKAIVRSDAFMGLPVSARELYFQLGMEGDDRGYVNNARSIIRQCGATQGDLEQLVQKKFVLLRGEGLLLIKAWCINNTIQPSRLSESNYASDLGTLFFDENGSYTTKATLLPCQQLVNNPSTNCQASIGKCSVVESSVVKCSKAENNTKKDTSSTSLYVKEVPEGNGLNTHQIVENFVKEGYIKDSETVRGMYLGLLQGYVERKDFKDSLETAIRLGFNEENENDTSIRFANFKSIIETLMGKR